MSAKSKKGGNPTQQDRVLADHKRVGNRFIPPWLQFVPLVEIRFVDFILPELLWLAILNDNFGLAKGAELALALPKVATKVNIARDTAPNKWFALTSSYFTLTKEQKQQSIKLLQSSDDLRLLKQALMPLIAFYPECPLNFLFEGSLPQLEAFETSLERFKDFLSTLFDKYEKPATLMQANAIYIAFVTGLLKVAEGLSLANFPAVADFPETEESKRIATSVRATVNGLGGNYLDPKQSVWSNYFWNRGLELQPCNYREIYETHEQ